MNSLTKEYDEIIKQIDKNNEKMKQLEEDEKVKEYFELKKQDETLQTQKKDAYKNMKVEEYESCEHILVYSKIEHDRIEGRTYKSCGCIKCGLDNSVLDLFIKHLSFNEKIMYEYLENHRFELGGIKTEISCDLALAQTIYSKIKEAHPDIDDKTAIKYFKSALDNIRNIEVSDERKLSRAKRLSLHSKFNRWNSKDIHID